MRSEFYGITSLGLIIVAIAIATTAAFLEWWMLGVLYLATCAACLLAILYAFCAKCPCHARCGHVFPGKLAALVSRDPGPYSRLETLVVVVALLLLVGLPQLWLWRYVALAAAFWLSVAVAVVEIRAFVCRVCDNVCCPVSLAGT